MKNLLKDYTVIEFASVLAGPSVGMFLAELGARVVKIENPISGGDVTRSWKLATETESEISSYYNAINIGKEIQFLNLTEPTDRNEVDELLSKAQIVVSSFRPDSSVRLGFDALTIRQKFPSMICGSITGYGQHSSRSGYDAVVEAETGFMYMNGEPLGKPIKMPVALIDVLAGHQLKEAILGAVIHRERTGEGATLSVSLFDTAISSLVNQATSWLVAGVDPERIGSEHPNIVPYGVVYSTFDRHQIVLAVGSDTQFFQLCQELEIAEVAHDSRYGTNHERVANRKSLELILDEAISGRSCSELLTALANRHVPAGRVNRVSDVFNLPEAQRLVVERDGLKGVKAFVVDWE